MTPQENTVILWTRILLAVRYHKKNKIAANRALAHVDSSRSGVMSLLQTWDAQNRQMGAEPYAVPRVTQAWRSDI